MQVPELRKKSRIRYLGERVEDKLAELEADIIDNEYLFAETKYVITIWTCLGIYACTCSNPVPNV